MDPVARAEPAFLVVGHVSRPHGMRGELFVEPLTDHPGDVFAPGVVLRPADAEGVRPDPELPRLSVSGARPFRRGWLITCEGIADRDSAETFRARYLMVERKRLPPLAEGEVFHHQLLGMSVVTADGRGVGEVIEVYDVAPVDLLEVRTDQGKMLLPFVEALVREVDTVGRRLVIDPPEGLLEP